MLAFATSVAWAALTGAFVFADALHHFLACGFGSSGHDFTARRFAQAAPQRLTTHGDGLCFFVGLRAKSFDRLDGNGLAGEPLDLLRACGGGGSGGGGSGGVGGR